MRTKAKISSLVFLVALVLFSGLFLPISEAFDKDVEVGLEFLLIGLLSGMGMFVSSLARPFSIRFIFYFYCFAFMFCAGLTQFATGKFLWEFQPNTNEIHLANLCVLVFLLFFAISRIRVFPKTTVKIERNASIYKEELVFKQAPFWLFSIILLLIGCYPLLKGGVRVLLSREIRGQYSLYSLIGNSSIRSIFSSIINGTSMFFFILTVKQLRRHRTLANYLCVAFSAINLVLNVPPLAVARYNFVAVYGGVFLYFSNWLKKGKRFVFLLAFGLLFVFPALNAFRYSWSSLTLEQLETSLGNISSNFTRADYDGYTMLTYTLRYTSVSNFSYGRQLLGAILFFVPRSFWPNKPTGSGDLIISSLAPSYIDGNVSCPFISEGYINFGLVGVILFAFVLSKVTMVLDDSFWTKNKNCSECYKILYAYGVMFSLFMFRGDLMSSTAFGIGTILTIICLSWAFKGKPLSKNERINAYGIQKSC